MRTYARRYVAALVAIVIATGFIVAIYSLSSAAREGSGESIATQYRGADVAAPFAGDNRMFEDMRRTARADPSVIAMAVNWRAYTGATFPDGPQNVSIGSIAHAPDLRWQRAAEGRLPVAADEIAASLHGARRHHVDLGDTITLDVDDHARHYTVTALVDDTNGPLSALLYAPEESGLRAIGAPVDAVFAVEQGASAEVIGRLDKVTGDGVARTGATWQRALRLSATQGVDVLQKLIFVFAGISLFVGALVIANTFTILLAQRARELALLRCVGAVRTQIVRSVVAEGILIGALGSLVGVTFGYAIARLGDVTIGALSPQTPMGTPTLTFGSVLVPLLLGIAVTVLASYLPTRRASSQSPLAALQPKDPAAFRARAGMVRLSAAALLLVVGGGGLVLGLRGSLPVGMLGGMLSFIGVLLVTPVLVPGAIRAFGPVARRAGVPGRLAHSNALRNPRRTAATSTALLIGVTLITSVVIGSASIAHKVKTEIDGRNPIDLAASSPHRALPAGIVKEFGAVNGVERAVAVSGSAATVDSNHVTVLGVDSASLGLVHDNKWLRNLGPNTIVVPSASDAFPTAEAGKPVSLQIGGQRRELKVLFAPGIGDSAIVGRSTLDGLHAHTEPRAVWIRAAEGADASDVTADLMAISKTSGLEVSGGLPQRSDVLKTLGVVLAITVGLLTIAVVIALIGVGNTLSLSVLERVRENSLLRALGLERSGLRTMLAIEALLMAGVSAVLGIGLGSLYAWFGVKTLSHGMFETSPSLIVPWLQIATIVAVAVISGLVASVLPARRAARIMPAAGLVAD